MVRLQEKSASPIAAAGHTGVLSMLFDVTACEKVAASLRPRSFSEMDMDSLFNEGCKARRGICGPATCKWRKTWQKVREIRQEHSIVGIFVRATGQAAY